MGRTYQDVLLATASRAEHGLLRERARLAQRRKDWPEAERLWRECWQRSPQDRNTAAGYIGILIYANNLSEAEVLARRYIEEYPKDDNGPTFLARIAEARGDWNAAIEYWQATLAVEPSKLQALIRLGDALIACRRYGDARRCAERLCARHPTEPHGPILNAKIVQQESGYPEAALLWQAGMDAFADNTHFARAYGRALFAAGRDDDCLQVAEGLRGMDAYESLRLTGLVLGRQKPHADHTDFWAAALAQLPANMDFMRKLLHASLSAGRRQEAEAAMAELTASGQARASDSDYAVGMANVQIASGDWSAARRTVRKFLRSLYGRSDLSIAALRLNRIVAALFSDRRPGTTRRQTPAERFVRAVKAAPITAAARQSLEGVVALQNRLSQQHRTCLFDTDVLRCECAKFVDLVQERLRDRRPFSFIRLGDGESNALGYDERIRSHFEADAAEREAIWWGQPLESNRRSSLAVQVARAIADADCLGIPTIARLLRDVRLESVQDLQATRSGRGLLSVMHAVERLILVPPDCALTSAHLHQDLERWGLYPSLLGAGQEVVAVSCHAGLPMALRERFGANVVAHILVPPRHYSLSAFDHGEIAQGSLPNRLEAILDRLADWPNGRLVLVGAGYAGKIAIGEAKRRGGIVLDLGSMLDYWAGLRTRSFQDIG